MKSSVTWKIGGEAGFGIISSGSMLARSFSRVGYHVLVTNEYPSLIRGGHNLITVRIATEKFESLNKDLHILVALNKETIDLHKNELTSGALVVYDPTDIELTASSFTQPVVLVPVSFLKIVMDLGGDRIMRNTVAIGATIAILGAEFSLLETVIKDVFKRKGEEVIALNTKIARAGYDVIKGSFSSETSMYIDKAVKQEEQLLMNASEAVGVGAVRAGLKFAAIYPMTPINSLITFLADHAKEFNIVYKQPEDELAGMNMALGASYAGVRSMVATSGGGFALMTEALSLAGIMELPIVIDLGMRVGPATGMPTWTEQGELQFAIHAGHGEFPRIILAPGDAYEAYSATVDAFNLADVYQVPVFVLTDKYINESLWCVPTSAMKQEVVINRGKIVHQEELNTATTEFKRYSLDVPDGVSPRSLPGMKKGFYYTNSYEHDEAGHVTESASGRVAMAAKRLKKFDAIQKVISEPLIYGDVDSEITLLCWGSTKGPVIDAMNILRSMGKKTRVIQFIWMYPFPTTSVAKLLANTTRIIDIEQNATGQLASLIREHTGIDMKEKFLKNDGRPWFPEDIIERLGDTI